MRKIVQINSAVAMSFMDARLFLYALCDDGSVWVRCPWADDEKNKHWDRVEDIPQDG